MMKRFFAAAYKDLCLFFQGAGIAAFLLPFLLLGCFYLLFMHEEDAIASVARVEPFKIAIRDEDETMMTRVLLDQVREIELFSEVYKVQGESDEELLAEGYAAVLTERYVQTFDRNLSAYDRSWDVLSSSRAIARPDGTVLLVGNSETKLFIP